MNPQSQQPQQTPPTPSSPYSPSSSPSSPPGYMPPTGYPPSGYLLSGYPPPVYPPYPGAPLAQPPYYALPVPPAPLPPMNGLALASVLLSLVFPLTLALNAIATQLQVGSVAWQVVGGSGALLQFLILPFGISAAACGTIALSRANQRRPAQDGRGLAIVAVVLGYLCLGAGIVAICSFMNALASVG